MAEVIDSIVCELVRKRAAGEPEQEPETPADDATRDKAPDNG